jgi:hypothetical protein
MKKRKFGTPSLKVGFSMGSFNVPKFWSFRIPIGGGIYMGGGKIIVGSLSAVALGFLAALFLLVSTGEQQITFPMLGASYEAPSMVGHTIVDAEFPAQRSQTLQLNIPQGTRLDEVSFENISLGKGGLTNAFQLTGTSTTDMITIDTLIIEDSEFPTMDLANGYIYTLNATSSVTVDGHTFSPTMASSTNDVRVSSTRGAVSYAAKDMIVDRIIIRQTTTGGDVLIKLMRLTNVNAWTGAADFDYFEIGTLILRNVRIGNDGDINTAAMVINDSVDINTFNDGVVDEPIFIR